MILSKLLWLCPMSTVLICDNFENSNKKTICKAETSWHRIFFSVKSTILYKFQESFFKIFLKDVTIFALYLFSQRELSFCDRPVICPELSVEVFPEVLTNNYSNFTQISNPYFKIRYNFQIKLLARALKAFKEFVYSTLVLISDCA
jgi:hypothetical protein